MDVEARTADERIRVAFVVNNLNVGGLEKVVLSLVSNIDRRRFDPYLICIAGAGKLYHRVDLPSDRVLICEKSAGSRVGPLNVDFRLLREVRRFLKAGRIQLVHAHNLGPLLYGGLAARSMWQGPAVIYSEHNQVYSAGAALRRRFRQYIRLAHHTIAVSKDLAEFLRHELSLRVPISVIHNGIPAVLVPPEARERLRTELRLESTDFVVGTAVVLSRQKGIPHLLEAAQRLQAAGDPIKFLIAGDGPERTALEADAEARHLRNVRFLGYRSDVPSLLAAFDLYVLPSLWEGLPLALIEALSAGKMVVATAVGGNAEVVEHGVNGLIVPPGNADALVGAVTELRSNEELRLQASTVNVRRFAEHFSVDTMVRAHETLFWACLRRGKLESTSGRERSPANQPYA